MTDTITIEMTRADADKLKAECDRLIRWIDVVMSIEPSMSIGAGFNDCTFSSLATHLDMAAKNPDGRTLSMYQTPCR